MTASLQEKNQGTRAQGGDFPIAIVGIGCRYADARGPEEFWEILRSGRNTVRDVPQHRIDLGYDVDHFYDPRLRIPGKVSSKKAGFLEHPELFDPAAFGIAPRDALTMEPQQRLMVEVAWDALEDAGIPPASVVGERVAVILGYMAEDYSREKIGVLGEEAVFRGHDVFTVGGMSHAVLSGRIAYLLGLTGPSFTLDTACSSSLIATHLACQSLRSGESKMALAGGVNVFLTPEGNIALSRSGMLSMSGACKAFDASADGFVRAEGAGIVLLRPLADAIEDGNPIYAVIRGSGISTDGRDGGHMMAPGRHGQAQAMRDAYAQAGLAPSEIHYVETHGTGTMIGDPIEIAALAEVMGPGRAPDQPLLVASVKGNLGHTESASGVAGLIKAALSIYHRELPAQLHFEKPNPVIPWDDVPIRVHATHSSWPYPGPARAGVNSFGISGTNAHVVLESPPGRDAQERPGQPSRKPILLPITSHDSRGLRSMVESHRDALLNKEPNALEDLAYTLSRRRDHRAHRLTVVARTADEMRRELDAYLEGNASASVSDGVASASGTPKIVMVFPGQGSQWFGMGRVMLKAEPVFEASIDRIELAFAPYVDWSLREMLEAKGGPSSESDWTKRLDVVQPVLVAMEIALANLWESWGIRPHRVIGQSMGEIAAAHIAGCLELDDVARLVCHRGKIVAQAAGRGSMAVVSLSREDVSREIDAMLGLTGRVEIAGSNSPTTTILSGDRDAIVEVVAAFDRQGVFARQLEVDFASHCFHMDSLLAPFKKGIESIKPMPALIPFDSTVDDAEKTGDDLDADYWVRNLREPVAFDRGLRRSISAGGEIVVEVSPHPILARATEEIASVMDQPVLHVASLQRGQDDQQSLMASVGRLFSRGVAVDWKALHPMGQVVRLPLYSYQRKRFWFAERNRSHRFRQTHPLLGMCSESSLDPRLRTWDFILDADSAGFIQDYRVDGKAGAPMALYPELVLAALEARWPGARIAIQRFEFTRALVFGQTGRCMMQVVLRADSEQRGEIQIATRESAAENWIGLASCEFAPVDQDFGLDRKSNGPTSPACVLDRTGNQVSDSESYFSALERCGIQLGPKCRTLRELEREVVSGDVQLGASVARMMLPRAVETEWYAYHAHPAILEGCFQLAGTVLSEMNAMRVRSFKRFTLTEALGSDCWCRVTERHEGELDSIARGRSGWVCADLEFFNSDGQFIGALDGLEAESISPKDQGIEVVSKDLFSVEWQLDSAHDGKSGPDPKASLKTQLTRLSASGLLVPRLAALPARPRLDPSSEDLIEAGSRNFRAFHSGREGLNCVQLEEIVEPVLGDDEVMVEVAFVALSRLDVMAGLGMTRGGTRGPDSLAYDFSGKVIAISDQTSSYQVGDQVFGVHAGALNRRLAISTRLLAKSPDRLAEGEAAGLALPYLVAKVVLNGVARIEKGDRVLIVSASGGVGHAMIQVGRASGACVSVTASTENRRAYLRSLGVEVISIDPEGNVVGEDQFDVIVGSDSGAALHSMVAKLAPHGRYLDLCPRERFEQPELGTLKLGANRSFSTVDVVGLIESDPEWVSTLLMEIASEVSAGEYAAIPSTLFPLSQVDRALRWIAQGRQVGRVCLNFSCASKVQIIPRQGDASAILRKRAFVVSGEHAEFQLAISKMLHEQGASSIFDASRDRPEDFPKEASTSARESASEVESRTTWIHVASDSNGKGDGPSDFLEAKAYDRVLIIVREPAEGASDRGGVWEERLVADPFCDIRSAIIDSETGSPTDAYAVCLSISAKEGASRIESLLSEVLLGERREKQIVVLSKSELATRVEAGSSFLFENLERRDGRPHCSRILRSEMIALTSPERRRVMQRFVCDSLAAVQGLSEEQRVSLELASPIDSLGLDSLMTMELFVGMGRDLELEIAADWFQAGPTLGAIAEILTDRIEDAVAGAGAS